MAEGNKQDWTIGTMDGLNVPRVCNRGTGGEHFSIRDKDQTNEMSWFGFGFGLEFGSFLCLSCFFPCCLPCLAFAIFCIPSLTLFLSSPALLGLFFFVVPLSTYSQLSSPVHFVFVLTSLSFLATPCAIFRYTLILSEDKERQSTNKESISFRVQRRETRDETTEEGRGRWLTTCPCISPSVFFPFVFLLPILPWKDGLHPSIHPSIISLSLSPRLLRGQCDRKGAFSFSVPASNNAL